MKINLSNSEVALRIEAALIILRSLKDSSFPLYAVSKVVDAQDELELAVKFLRIQG